MRRGYENAKRRFGAISKYKAPNINAINGEKGMLIYAANNKSRLTVITFNENTE
jgi:hypothetical protein